MTAQVQPASARLPEGWGEAFLKGEVWAALAAVAAYPDATVRTLMECARQQAVDQAEAASPRP